MAAEKHTSKSRKIVDVAHPGKSAPSPNSRSVIISHRPIMRDPMMSADVPENTKEEVEAEAPTAVSVNRVSGNVLQPLNEPEAEQSETAPDEEAVASETAETDEPIAETAESEPETGTEAQAEDVADEKPSAPEQPSPEKNEAAEAPAVRSAGTDAKLGTKDVQSDAQIAAAEEAETKRQDELQEMIETKKYYLPINTVEKKRTKQFVAIGIILSIVLAVVWLDVALDAGLLKLGHLKAVTHFFN